MPVNPDGTLRPYNASEIAAFKLGTRGIRDGSNPEETYSPDGNGCTRKWMCDWAQRFDVIKHLVGQVESYNDSSTLKITRNLPQAHPTYSQWVCVKARLTGQKFIEDDTTGGEGNRIPRWDRAEITAQYEQVPFKLLADDAIDTELDRYVTKPGYPMTESEPFSDAVTMPGGIMAFKTAGGGAPHNKPVNHNLVIPQAGEKITAIWHRIPDTRLDSGTSWFTRVYGDPLGGTRPWIGSLNKTAIFGRPPLTCLLESVRTKRIPDPIGSGYSYNVIFTWVYRAQTHLQYIAWNTATPPAFTSGYYQISGIGVAYKADLTTLGDVEGLHHIRDHADGLFKISA